MILIHSSQLDEIRVNSWLKNIKLFVLIRPNEC